MRMRNLDGGVAVRFQQRRMKSQFSFLTSSLPLQQNLLPCQRWWTTHRKRTYPQMLSLRCHASLHQLLQPCQPLHLRLHQPLPHLQRGHDAARGQIRECHLQGWQTCLWWQRWRPQTQIQKHTNKRCAYLMPPIGRRRAQLMWPPSWRRRSTKSWTGLRPTRSSQASGSSKRRGA